MSQIDSLLLMSRDELDDLVDKSEDENEADRDRITDSFVLDCADELYDMLAAASTVPTKYRRPLGVDSFAFTQNLSELSGNLIPALAPLRVLRRPFDCQILHDAMSGWTRFSMERWRKISHKESRGKVTQFMPIIVREDRWNTQDFNRDQRSADPTDFWGSPNGFLWHRITQKQKCVGFYIAKLEPSSGNTSERLLRTIALQYTLERNWTISFRSPANGFGIVVIVPRGIIHRMFKHRDKSSGETRKKALRHLVSEHWRDIPSIEEMQTMVREHARGRIRFVWFDLECEILPSIRDIDRLREAEVERERLRSMGLDRRFRGEVESPEKSASVA